MKQTDQQIQDTGQSRSRETRYLSPQEDTSSALVEPTGAGGIGRAALDTMISIATLTVQESDERVQRRFDVQLNQHPLKLGRAPEGGRLGPNDIVLEAVFVARDQARIEPAGIGHTALSSLARPTA
jgi:hypothetical protein